jgi:carbon-monoxide dehydrogenase large subunit
LSILGTRVMRSEDPLFLTAGATYTEDLVDDRLTGALHATFVRSPIASATISGIDKAAALESPGVVAVITAEDMAMPAPAAAMPMYPPAMGQPLLATGVVRYVGEAVAVVLTEQAYQGEDAAELVDIDYDPLAPVIDPREARKDETLVFADFSTNTAWGMGLDAPAF